MKRAGNKAGVLKALKEIGRKSLDAKAAAQATELNEGSAAEIERLSKLVTEL